MESMVRLLTKKDIPAAFALSDGAGWNQTEEDWYRLLRLEPLGCFGYQEEDRIVATTTLLCHGTELAWLGMVLTHPDYRRRGLARQLVEAALAVADSRGIGCVKLDATDQGRPLYQQLGFEDEQPVERWYRPPGPLPVSPQSGWQAAPDSPLDRAAFGADRSRFLATLGDAQCLDEAFALHRSGARALYLGPCIARDPVTAASLLRGLVTSYAGEAWFWDMLPQQTLAVEIARTLGFAPVRHLMRMRRGLPLSADDSLVYALGGFEAG
jgi:GNAT superfamily N-acetyltransferase